LTDSNVADDTSRRVSTFQGDVVAGLLKRQKAISSRWLYDDAGSGLFEAITQQPEYYPTRVETMILGKNASKIAAFASQDAVLLEHGAGTAVKTEILLHALPTPRLYVPIDIAGQCLMRTVARLHWKFPALSVTPLVADFTADFVVPAEVPGQCRIAFFPGVHHWESGCSRSQALPAASTSARRPRRQGDHRR
jgi:uncharacterized SAM-dependent methyltransferase